MASQKICTEPSITHSWLPSAKNVNPIVLLPSELYPVHSCHIEVVSVHYKSSLISFYP